MVNQSNVDKGKLNYDKLFNKVKNELVSQMNMSEDLAFEHAELITSTFRNAEEK